MDIISMCHPTEVISVNMRIENSQLSHWSLRYVTRCLAHARSFIWDDQGPHGQWSPSPPIQARGHNRKGG